MKLLGGFAGGESTADERNPNVNVSILKGDLDDDDPSSLFDNSYSVVESVGNSDTAIIDGFEIRGGGAGNFGAGILISDSSTQVIRCTFTANAAVTGGGAHVEGDSEPYFTNCVFHDNDGGNRAGGLCNNGADVTIVNSLFYNNTAFYGGAGISNTAPQGQLIGTMTIVNSTIADNVATSTSDPNGRGGGIQNYTTLAVINCIIYGNEDGASSSTVDEQIYGSGTSLSVSYSCIEDDDPGSGTIPFGGAANNNIDEDPDFVNAAAVDYRLESTSPAINAGDNNTIDDYPDGFDLDADSNTTEPTPTLDLAQRIIYSDVDMGPFEYRCVGDLDGDGDIDFDDFTLLLANFGQVCDPDYPTGDLDRDCDVDFDDFTLLLANFGQECVPALEPEGDTLLELMIAAGLDEDDYDDYLDIMENGTQTQQDCWTGWLDHYLTCTSHCGTGHGSCPDPFLSN